MPDAPPEGTTSRTRASAYLGMPIAEFLLASPATLLGVLTESSNFDIELPQRGAWEETIEILKAALPGIDGYLYLEFDVPRLGSRIDVVVISGPAIIPIEFKAGESRYPREAINQAWDYALDLKNFHRASHHAPIFPILVATDAPPPRHLLGATAPRWCPAALLRWGRRSSAGNPICTRHGGRNRPRWRGLGARSLSPDSDHHPGRSRALCAALGRSDFPQ
jgi:hypothetical protein